MAQPGGGINEYNVSIGQKIIVALNLAAEVFVAGLSLFQSFQEVFLEETEENETASYNSGQLVLNSNFREKAAIDNRANQLNPNHQITGPGRAAGYHGKGGKFDLDNHANQLNPNNPLYQGRNKFK